MENELAYWMVLAHLPKMRTRRKNEIIVQLFERGSNLVEFYNSNATQLANEFGLKEDEIELFENAKPELANYAFMVEDLLDQGYKILPITSPDYSPLLKKNLGKSYAPPVIYTKGNLQILKEKSVAIVGSRKANDISLDFTDNVAKKASAEYKVVVSGFAKGVDKQALDSALKYKGQSIIVLPQGIATFNTGFKKYFKQIVDGDVLVLSTFYPAAPWSVQLAMGRNPIIYGLASEIYVAESSDTGGTWSGVVDGLRKERAIYVRKPDENEKNANDLLIAKGGVAVDQNGERIQYETAKSQESVVTEPDQGLIEDQILDLLKGGDFEAKNIVEKLQIDWTLKQTTAFLNKNESVIALKSKPVKYTHMSRDRQTSLF